MQTRQPVTQLSDVLLDAVLHRLAASRTWPRWPPLWLILWPCAEPLRLRQQRGFDHGLQHEGTCAEALAPVGEHRRVAGERRVRSSLRCYARSDRICNPAKNVRTAVATAVTMFGSRAATSPSDEFRRRAAPAA